MSVSFKAKNTQEVFDCLESAGLDWWIEDENTEVVEIGCDHRLRAQALMDALSSVDWNPNEDQNK